MKKLKGKEKEIAEKVIKLMIEKAFRCGDGLGSTLGHSMNCRCSEIDIEIKELKSNLT